MPDLPMTISTSGVGIAYRGIGYLAINSNQFWVFNPITEGWGYLSNTPYPTFNGYIAASNLNLWVMMDSPTGTAWFKYNFILQKWTRSQASIYLFKNYFTAYGNAYFIGSSSPIIGQMAESPPDTGNDTWITGTPPYTFDAVTNAFFLNDRIYYLISNSFYSYDRTLDPPR